MNDTTLSYQDQKISLTKNDYRILQTLMENKGKIVSRDTLMTKLWETDCYVDENTVSAEFTSGVYITHRIHPPPMSNQDPAGHAGHPHRQHQRPDHL